MRLWKHALTLTAAIAFAWPMAEATAQRGDRGGGDRGGQRGGDSNRGGRGGESGGRSFSSGQQRASSGGRQRGESQRRSNEAMQQRSRQQSQSAQRQSRTEGGQEQSRSFYRGQDVQDRSRQADRSSRDQSRRSDSNRSRSGFDEIDRRDRDRSDRPRDEARGRDNDRDSNRDRDFDRDQRNRRDRDFDLDNDRNRDRDDWDRFGRDDWRNRAYDVRRNWGGWYGGYGMIPFGGGWYNNYIGSNWPVYSPYRYSRWSNRPYYWWGRTPAAQLTDWVVFGWDRPRYWAYGPNANIYYRDNHVYYDGRQTYTVDDYYQRVYDLAHSVPNISEEEAENMDWRPLGVFALSRENQSKSERALQLAVNRDGVLTGTYFNRENGHVHPISGMVDDETQRAAWAFADGEHEDVVFETSIYNLTRSESTMMVHFGPQADATEVWQLVRLEQPDSNVTSRETTQRPKSSRSLP